MCSGDEGHAPIGVGEHLGRGPTINHAHDELAAAALFLCAGVLARFGRRPLSPRSTTWALKDSNLESDSKRRDHSELDRGARLSASNFLSL